MLGWVEVKWDNGESNSYRMGAEGKFDLYLENLPKVPDESGDEPPSDSLDPNASLIDPVSTTLFLFII